MQIYNYMEDAVDVVLPRILQDDKYKDLCTCEQCINDIKAIALNNLQPRYVSTEKGSVLSKANTYNLQSDIDVTKALLNAIDKVRKSPRHNA